MPMAMPVEVVRSPKRKKTVHAAVVDGRIRVQMPAWMSQAQEDTYVAELVERLEKRFRCEHVDLDARAAELARTYDLPAPHSVKWAHNQRSRWGSCTIAARTIRVSSRLADWPDWVLDYVIVHELAHLMEPNHSPAFHALVARYPLAERATGFLMAKGFENNASGGAFDGSDDGAELDYTDNPDHSGDDRWDDDH